MKFSDGNCNFMLRMLPPSVKSYLGLLPQEYLCVAKEDLPRPLSAHLTFKHVDRVIHLSDGQLLLGYNPLIMALRTGESNLPGADSACLNFGEGRLNPTMRWRGFPTDAHRVGRIEMKRHELPFSIPGWDLFVGVHGEHQFLNPYQRIVNAAHTALQRKPKSNANIAGNLYDQVRIAYSTPRQISVISVKDNELLNFFPTDLHGRMDGHHYISSLRIGGMACSQVETAKTIVISTVDVSAFREVYALGKNHMQKLQETERFGNLSVTTPSGIPVYPLATGYLELEVIDSADIGIHRLFLYRILTEDRVINSRTLAHVHAHYVQWRLNNGMSTEYFLR
jgi:hypothetical protein